MDHTLPHPEFYRMPYVTDEFNEMPYRQIGNSGLRASAIGLGTWKVGYPETGDGARINEKTALAIFDRAIELGVTFWDTANRYNDGSGNSERVIGRWLRLNPDQRRNVVIATKIFGCMDGRTPNHCRLSRTNILDSVYACLARLQTDHIDLLYFHTVENFTPLEESLCAVEDLVARDLVRYFGVGNLSVAQLEMYHNAIKQFSARARIVAVQNGFDVLRGETNPEHQGVLAYCASMFISYIAYSPLARGLLTPRYLDTTQVGQGDRLVDEGTLAQMATSTVMTKLQRLDALAHEWAIELNQLALAYTLTLPGMGTVIPAASSTTQLASNARAGKIGLNDEQKNRVREILEATE